MCNLLCVALLTCGQVYTLSCVVILTVDRCTPCHVWLYSGQLLGEKKLYKLSAAMVWVLFLIYQYLQPRHLCYVLRYCLLWDLVTIVTTCVNHIVLVVTESHTAVTITQSHYVCIHIQHFIQVLVLEIFPVERNYSGINFLCLDWNAVLVCHSIFLVCSLQHCVLLVYSTHCILYTRNILWSILKYIFYAMQHCVFLVCIMQHSVFCWYAVCSTLYC